MTALLLGALAGTLSFFLGVLIGNGYTTRVQDARDRRQAAVQRALNDQIHALREEQNADLNEITNEAPRRARRRGSH